MTYTRFFGAAILLKLETGIDLTSMTALRIYYRKPDGTRGFWTGTAEGTKITSQLTSQLDQTGDWQLQAMALNGSAEYPGDKALLVVEKRV